MNTCSRREFLKRAAIGSAAMVLPSSLAWANAVPKTRPNLLLILADDLGYGDLSCYGASDVRTPHLDSLMAEGVRFDQFYANSPVCSPTRASLLTGRYPDLVGVQGVTSREQYLAPSALLLPQLLTPHGYQTSLIGKWHLGEESPNLPNDRGFVTFFGTHYGMVRSYTGHAQDQGRPTGFWSNREPIAREGHATDLCTDLAIETIRKQAGKKTPFFLYLAYHAPHTPIEPKPEWLARVKERQPDLKAERAKYVAMVEHLDDGIGKVLAALKRAGAADNTIVIFASDNGATGYGSNKPLRGYKRQMFEGGIRVPCCFSWPGQFGAGMRSAAVGMTMDVLPTLCDALGIQEPGEVDGMSLLPTLRGEPQVTDQRFLFWMRRNNERLPNLPYYAARFGDFKLLQNNPNETFQLYNLKADPGERQPLDEKHEMYAKLIEALREHITRSGAVPWQKPGVHVHPPQGNS